MNLTKRLQEFTQRNMTLEDALPTKMPVYVNSIAYLFGVATLSALVMLIITGMILAIFGPNWYHVSATGRLFNSIHFWSAQIFFACIVLHMLTKLLLGAWRDGRWKTWMIGVLTLGVSIFAGFTGYLSATNWSSLWHSVQAKDAMNAIGIGAFFNTTNLSQVITLHVAFFPFLIIILVAIHLTFIRNESPVKPYPREEK
ncbi:MAG: cytochrome b N-terminal domain-containing protein [Spirochaetia bacterium]|jgi:ubiquinol-cytochrome c reductase cytochrome b subunit